MIELKELIQKLKELRTEEKLKISDEILFDAAMRLHISNNISNQKKPKLDNKATEKQINIMKKLNISFNELTTIEDAQRKIKERLGK